jgi:hypothetical protein
MSTAVLKASRALWLRRERDRHRKWQFYKSKSKRPAAERMQLRAKWWKLYEEARRQRVRRDRQLVAATPLRERALAEILKLVGVMEVGGNNQGPKVTEIIRANGGTGPEPWCGDTVAWAYRHAGSKVVQRAWAAVRYLGFLTGMTVVKDPQPGDIVCFSFDHTAIFKCWVNRTSGLFEDVEGNTGRAGAVSDSATGGDGVYVKHRNVNLVARFVRVTR